MQLFSRNKALAALSLSALAVLGACGDDVTVPAPVNPAVVLSISPSNANMNVGESLNFAVQITGGSTTTPPTLASCTSSNTAVVTVAVSGSACRATAVAAGNATITAAASTGNQASSAVSVSAPAPAITSLGVSPAAAQLAVGQTVTIVPTVQPAGRTATYAYTTSSAAIATVAATGVVTAVAPGVATITVTATAAAQSGLAAATIAQAVTITVSDRTPGLTQLSVQPATVALALNGTQALTPAVQGPRASAATSSYGTSAPSVATVSATGVITAVAAGQAVVTVTASSTESGAFAASSLTALVPVTVSPAAQVTITSLTDNGMTIDITNVIGQFEVNMNLQPNGQNVSALQAWVCDTGETIAACQARSGTPAAQQSYGAGGAQAGIVQLYINSAEFAAPNFTTGADVATTYKNGLKQIVATVVTTPNSSTPNASNTITSVNFNNPDGWTASWTLPNRAQDAAGVTWYGGPATPDALLPGSTSGTGSFTVVPVIYTPNRTVLYASLAVISGGVSSCGALIVDSIRPFAGSYGAQSRSTANVAFNCSGVASAANTVGFAPGVVGAVDNTNAGAYPAAAHGNLAGVGLLQDGLVGNPIFTQINNTNAAVSAGRFRMSSTYRPTNQYVPVDYVAPAIARFDVRGGGAASVDSGWVNAAYVLDQRTGLGAQLRYQIADAAVGLLPTRNTVFDVCSVPATISTSAPTLCGTPTASGGLSSTIGSLGLPENASNFTNRAYFAISRETDRLGNRATSNPYQYTDANGNVFAATAPVPVAANGLPGGQEFGVDLTAPVLAVIANTGTGNVANFARTDVDSIYSALGNTYGTTNNTNAVFAVRFTDARAGFYNCVNGTNCPAAAPGGNVRGGSFQIVRRSAPVLPSLANDAVVENTVTAASSATLTRNNALNSAVYAGDAAYREFMVNIFGDNTRNTATVPTGNISAAQAGYYTFSGTLQDRALNTTAIPARSVAIDNVVPQITGITVPPVLTGGTSVAFGPTGTDDLEAIAGDLSLRYTQLGYDFGGPGNAVVAGQPNTIRFRRVTSYSASSVLGLWHNPFASLSDNKLATPIGAATVLGAAQLPVPVPFIQNIVNVSATHTPITQAQTFAAFGAADEARPNQVTAWIYDIRASMANNNIGTGISAALNATIFGGQIPTPAAAAQASNWGVTQGIIDWQIFNAANVSGFEYRAQTSTSVTNPPFSAVYIVRQVGATEWEYLGTASALGQLDQGGNRFWRYGITTSAINQGAGSTMAALGNADMIRAIGVDASGNGLSTRSAMLGLAPALPAGSGPVVPAPAVAASFTNAAAAQVITLALTANVNNANLVWSCSSNSTFITATMTSPTQCTLTPNGVVNSGSVPVTVTFSAAGSLAGFNPNSVSTTFNTSRIP